MDFSGAEFDRDIGERLYVAETDGEALGLYYWRDLHVIEILRELARLRSNLGDS